MADSGPDFFERGLVSFLSFRHLRFVKAWGKRWLPALQVIAMLMIALMAFSTRLFAVIRYESVIHEFDPYFNFRTTEFLTREGFYAFWDWFDDRSWYPLGRVIGQTLFPGLMVTAASLHQILLFCGMPIAIRDVCVFIGPIFAALTSVAAYGLTVEAYGKKEAGLLSALFIALCPSYMSRSVAGSYDNEAIAIFALVFSFYVYVRALNRGTLLSGTFAALAYAYMVSAWGGYVFVLNTIAIFTLLYSLLVELNYRHYIVYATFYILGTAVCVNIPFVNIQAIHSAEHMSSHMAFFILSTFHAAEYLRSLLPNTAFKNAARIFAVICTILCFVFFGFLVFTGRTQWAGRSMTLLDPSYAAKHIPIIASVSEHQPTTWTNYFFDLHVLVIFMPMGLGLSFLVNRPGMFFVGTCAVLAVYFSGVMIRLMLVLAPLASVLGGIAVSYTLTTVMRPLHPPPVFATHAQVWMESQEAWDAEDMSLVAKFAAAASGDKKKRMTSKEKKRQNRDIFDAPSSQQSSTLDSESVEHDEGLSLVYPRKISICVIAIIFLALWSFICHSVFAASFAYSHPSIVQSHNLKDGTRVIQDDFREAYSWLRHNTHSDARLMSWWDYGYQSCTMGNRTVLVDNNTWNNTHIATVGLAFASPEEKAFQIVKELDVDFVFVVFGGVARFSGDDINKFLWMVRIAGGIYPHIREEDYYSKSGQYSIGPEAAPAMSESLMYRLTYYRYADGPYGGYDQLRREDVGLRKIELKHFEEAYTTSNWIVRIYRVMRPENRGPSFADTAWRP